MGKSTRLVFVLLALLVWSGGAERRATRVHKVLREAFKEVKRVDAGAELGMRLAEALKDLPANQKAQADQMLAQTKLRIGELEKRITEKTAVIQEASAKLAVLANENAQMTASIANSDQENQAGAQAAGAVRARELQRQQTQLNQDKKVLQDSLAELQKLRAIVGQATGGTGNIPSSMPVYADSNALNPMGAMAGRAMLAGMGNPMMGGMMGMMGGMGAMGGMANPMLGAMGGMANPMMGAMGMMGANPMLGGSPLLNPMHAANNAAMLNNVATYGLGGLPPSATANIGNAFNPNMTGLLGGPVQVGSISTGIALNGGGDSVPIGPGLNADLRNSLSGVAEYNAANALKSANTVSEAFEFNNVATVGNDVSSIGEFGFPSLDLPYTEETVRGDLTPGFYKIQGKSWNQATRVVSVVQEMYWRLNPDNILTGYVKYGSNGNNPAKAVDILGQWTARTGEGQLQSAPTVNYCERYYRRTYFFKGKLDSANNVEGSYQYDAVLGGTFRFTLTRLNFENLDIPKIIEQDPYHNALLTKMTPNTAVFRDILAPGPYLLSGKTINTQMLTLTVIPKFFLMLRPSGQITGLIQYQKSTATILGKWRVVPSHTNASKPVVQLRFWEYDRGYMYHYQSNYTGGGQIIGSWLGGERDYRRGNFSFSVRRLQPSADVQALAGKFNPNAPLPLSEVAMPPGLLSPGRYRMKGRTCGRTADRDECTQAPAIDIQLFADGQLAGSSFYLASRYADATSVGVVGKWTNTGSGTRLDYVEAYNGAAYQYVVTRSTGSDVVEGKYYNLRYGGYFGGTASFRIYKLAVVLPSPGGLQVTDATSTMFPDLAEVMRAPQQEGDVGNSFTAGFYKVVSGFSQKELGYGPVNAPQALFYLLQDGTLTGMAKYPPSRSYDAVTVREGGTWTDKTLTWAELYYGTAYLFQGKLQCKSADKCKVVGTYSFTNNGYGRGTFEYTLRRLNFGSANVKFVTYHPSGQMLLPNTPATAGLRALGINNGMLGAGGMMMPGMGGAGGLMTGVGGMPGLMTPLQPNLNLNAPLPIAVQN